MHDIFLSYAKEDKQYAQTISNALEKEGFDVWLDINIPIGKTFDSVIEKAIEDTKCVVVLWSKHSIASEWVHTEAAEGKVRNILVPVRIEDVKIPLAFKRRQTADLINWNKKQTDPLFKNLVKDIRLIVHGEIKDNKFEETNKKGFVNYLQNKLERRSTRLLGFLLIVISISAIWFWNWQNSTTTELDDANGPILSLDYNFVTRNEEFGLKLRNKGAGVAYIKSINARLRDKWYRDVCNDNGMVPLLQDMGVDGYWTEYSCFNTGDSFNKESSMATNSEIFFIRVIKGDYEHNEYLRHCKRFGLALMKLYVEIEYCSFDGKCEWLKSDFAEKSINLDFLPD